MARLRLERLTKTFGTVVAVDEVSLQVEHGEFLALLGPSGCGKTTILLMLAGIYRPTAGEIYFDEVEVSTVSPQNRGVGLVFQSYALYPHMTAFENIAFPLRLQRTPPAEIRRRVEAVAQLAQIGELLHRRPSQMSGGQQQRVALCRALVKNPHLLLLDEPLSNLDARLRIETRVELKRLQRELGITTILVTHDQVEAMTMAERIAVMRNGVIEQCSPPRELYTEPANLFVASFIGDPPMNLIPASYRRGDAAGILEGPGFSLPAPDELARAAEDGGTAELVLGIRPEDIRLAGSEEAGAFPGEVFLTEPLGRDTLVDFRFNGTTVRVLASGERPVRVGETVWLAPDPARIHAFDAQSKRRLRTRPAGRRQERAG